MRLKRKVRCVKYLLLTSHLSIMASFLANVSAFYDLLHSICIVSCSHRELLPKIESLINIPSLMSIPSLINIPSLISIPSPKMVLSI